MRICLVACLLVLAGCGQPPAAGAGTCGAGRLGGWIGQPATALDEQYLPEEHRLVAPGMAVTQDYRPNRLNVLLDRQGRITGFRCG